MLESLLATYGYPVLIIGTFLEGETVLLLGGLAAQRGYLSLDWVIICGFCGTLFGDQLYFFLGRRHGKTLLARYPSWQPRIKRALRLLERHQNLLILGFRFVYGLRSVTAFAVGISDVSYVRFALLNLIGASIWAIAIGCAGYYSGRAAEAILGDIKRYEVGLMLGIGGLAMLIWLVHFYRQRRSARSAS